MKFIHFCNVRLGSNEESGTRWEQERYEEKKRSFENAVSRAYELGASFVVIAGGLFAEQPTTEDLDYVNNVFRAVPNIRFIIIAGKRDIIRKNSQLLSYKWADNVYYSCSERRENYVFDDEDTEFSVLSYTNDNEYKIEEIKPVSDKGIKIAVCAETDIEKVKMVFKDSDFDYVVLSGKTLEPKRADDKEKHGFYLVDIDEEKTESTFVPVNTPSYITLKVEMNAETTEDAVKATVAEEIEKRGEKNIYRIRLTGKKDPEMKPDFSEFKNRFRISEILDETEPEYDFQRLFSEHPQDMIGFYIGAIRRRKTEMSPLEKKAMYLGIEALLKTAKKE